jgi:hypothetical protein
MTQQYFFKEKIYKTPNVGIPILQTEYEVWAIKHNPLAE